MQPTARSGSLASIGSLAQTGKRVQRMRRGVGALSGKMQLDGGVIDGLVDGADLLASDAFVADHSPRARPVARQQPPDNVRFSGENASVSTAATTPTPLEDCHEVHKQESGGAVGAAPHPAGGTSHGAGPGLNQVLTRLMHFQSQVGSDMRALRQIVLSTQETVQRLGGRPSIGPRLSVASPAASRKRSESRLPPSVRSTTPTNSWRPRPIPAFVDSGDAAPTDAQPRWDGGHSADSTPGMPAAPAAQGHPPHPPNPPPATVGSGDKGRAAQGGRPVLISNLSQLTLSTNRTAPEPGNSSPPGSPSRRVFAHGLHLCPSPRQGAASEAGSALSDPGAAQRRSRWGQPSSAMAFMERMRLGAGAREDPEVRAAVRQMRPNQVNVPRLALQGSASATGEAAIASESVDSGAADSDADSEDEELFVLLPDSPLRALWDIAYVGLTLWEACMWMLAIFTFDKGTPVVRSPSIPLAVLRTCFWLADLWVQSRTAVLDGWEIDDDPQSVSHAYLRGRFVYDLLPSLPFDILFYYALGDSAFWFAMSARILRLFSIPSVVFRPSTPIAERPRWVEIFVGIFWFGILVQLLTCTWMVVANEEEQGITKPVRNDPYNAYLGGLHFIVTSVTSVGYGDVSPETGWAKVHNIVVQFIGVFLLIVVSGHTAAYFITTDPFRLMIIERKRRIQSLMATNQVPWSIQKQALTVYPVLLEASVKDYQSVLLELPDFVQDRIGRHIKVRLLSRVPLFREVSTGLLTHLAEVLEEDYCDARSYIITAGEQGSEMCFLQYGVVEVLVPTPDGGEAWVANLRSGSWFGEIALIQETTRVASVRSLTACVLYKLGKVHFDQIVAGSRELRDVMRREIERRLEAARSRGREPASRRQSRALAPQAAKTGSDSRSHDHSVQANAAASPTATPRLRLQSDSDLDNTVEHISVSEVDRASATFYTDVHRVSGAADEAGIDHRVSVPSSAPSAPYTSCSG
eukprot:TRINITY_DN18655_c3_g1_i1.p1 TRINITY_DN18655_c3_g1~~TRINITY_DN18655_c3_g1_i1.p1  ORF type:complete len:975 (+),score=174.57 TRINITY_DN18655_c3_g1_i1:220-3144(+)